MMKELFTSDAPNRPITTTLLFLISLELLFRGDRLIALLSLTGRYFSDLRDESCKASPLFFFFLMMYALRVVPAIVFPYSIL